MTKKKKEEKVIEEPVAVAEPKKETPKSDPNQLSLFDQPKESSLNTEIDKLEKEWDDIYEVYLENKDPKLKEKLSELDKVIEKKLDQLNNMSGDNLPF